MTDTGTPLFLNKPVDGDNARTAMLALATNMQTINDFVATAKANLLVNGGFLVWQRGDGAFTTNGAYTADRWQMAIQSGTMSVAKETGTPYECGAKVINNNPGAANVLAQKVEVFDLKRVKSKAFALSVTAYVPTGCSFQARIYDGVSGATATQAGDNAYHTVTVTGTMDANATELSAYLYFDGNGTFYVTNAMLVYGSVACDYSPLPVSDEWARCQRYYETLGGADSAIYLAGYSSDATNFDGALSLTFAARKVVTPTTTRTGTWAVTNCAQPTLAASQSTVSVITDVTASGMYVARTDSADDGIVAEANP